MTVCLTARNWVMWGLVVMGMSVVLGCGHKATHGTHTHSKSFSKAKDVAYRGTSDLTKPTRNHATGQRGEGYFPGMDGNFSDLLDESSLIQEESHFDPNQDQLSSPTDYWVTRTRAEQLTASSGLQDIHFSFNSYQLNDRAKAILRNNAEWLKANPEAEVTIEGHCDDRGTTSYNYVLGEKRALRAKAYLTSLGVSPARLQIMSLGKDQPACWDPTEPCYQKNRRAHLVLGLQVTSTAMR